MDPLVLNCLIFGSCYGVSITHHWIVHKHHGKYAAHGHVKATLLAGVVNPATADAIKEFAVHIIIYSGWVIPKH